MLICSRAGCDRSGDIVDHVAFVRVRLEQASSSRRIQVLGVAQSRRPKGSCLPMRTRARRLLGSQRCIRQYRIGVMRTRSVVHQPRHVGVMLVQLCQNVPMQLLRDGHRERALNGQPSELVTESENLLIATQQSASDGFVDCRGHLPENRAGQPELHASRHERNELRKLARLRGALRQAAANDVANGFRHFVARC